MYLVSYQFVRVSVIFIHNLLQNFNPAKLMLLVIDYTDSA